MKCKKLCVIVAFDSGIIRECAFNSNLRAILFVFRQKKQCKKWQTLGNVAHYVISDYNMRDLAWLMVQCI